MNSDWSLIILAAGKGTRMRGDVPKPLVRLGDKSLIQPIIDTGLSLGLREVIIVISAYTQAIREHFTDTRITYVETEPKGTGAAVQAALAHVATRNVIIAQADDSYFYTRATLERLMQEHAEHTADCSVGVVRSLENLPYAWAESHASGRLVKIHKQLADLEKAPPKDVVAGLYAMNVGWVTPKLARVPENSKGEVSLPPVIDYGLEEGSSIFVFQIPAVEWYGVNTPEELARAQEKVLSKA